MSAGPLAVFDIGGTLVDGPDRGPARRLATLLGLEREQRRALRDALMTRPFESAAEVAGFVRDELGMPGPEAAVGELWEAQEREAEPVAGALEALTSLAEHGVRLALISNIWRPYLVSVRRHYGEFFDRHVPPPLQLYSFQVECAKPSAAIFRQALAAAAVPASEAVMIGDSYAEDIEAAAAVGMATVWVRDDDADAANTGRPPGAVPIPPPRTVRSVAEVDFELVTEVTRASAAGGGLADPRG
jgi:HAD superfamily hydrolase (TIGR01662 family)